MGGFCLSFGGLVGGGFGNSLPWGGIGSALGSAFDN